MKDKEVDLSGTCENCWLDRIQNVVAENAMSNALSIIYP